MAIGSDSPLFAYYPDGTLIFWKETGDLQGHYRTINLRDTQEEAILLEKLTDIQILEKHYSLTTWTDQPTFEARVATTGITRTISVYGDIDVQSQDKNYEFMQEQIERICERRPENCESLKAKSKGPVRTPEEFLALWNFLEDSDWNPSEPWEPSHLEVMLWPYEYAPDDSIIWPAEWPDLEDVTTIERREDFYSVYLPARFEVEFLNFINTRKQKGAVLINGRKMTVSVRTPFPHELKNLSGGE